jgi:hypothetical protein
MRRVSFATVVLVAAIITLAGPVSPARADIKTWDVGSVGSGNVNTSGNWTPSGVPGGSDDAVLPDRAAGAYTATCDLATWAVADLQVSGNATLATGSNKIETGTVTAASGTIDVGAGGELNVTGGAWTNNGAITLAGGSITGQTMSQQGVVTVSAGSGTSSIEKASYTSGVGNTTTVNAGAALEITSASTLQGDISGYDGALTITSTGSLSGRGNLRPVLTVAGSLDANQSGNELNCRSGLTVASGGSVSATNGGTLKVLGTTTTVQASASLTASGGGDANLYKDCSLSGTLSADGGTIRVKDDLTIEAGGLARSQLAGTFGNLTIESAADIYNRGTVAADGGLVTIQGTIKAGVTETGTFRADGSTMTISGTLENGCRNSFIASSGGAIVFTTDLATGSFFAGGAALDPDGGTINVDNGRTLTISAGDTVSGAGALLDDGRFLVVDGTISAAGVLEVHGDITNNGTIQADGAGNAVAVGSSLDNEAGAEIAATNGGVVRLDTATSNSGLIRAGASSRVESTATITNEAAGMVRVHGGGDLDLAGLVNAGTISVEGAGSTLTCTSYDGSGELSMAAGATVTADSFTVQATGTVNDNSGAAAITVTGAVSNSSTQATTFDADQITLRIADPSGGSHDVAWRATDLGDASSGLVQNLALGTLVFGDGSGAAGSDTFTLSTDTIIYAYGVQILSDASVDLNGATIYYLPMGLSENGLAGQGFVNDGAFVNGDVLPLQGQDDPVGEPTWLAALAAAAWLTKRRRG